MTDLQKLVNDEVVSIELNEEKYNDFLRCLTNLKEPCNDVDIRNGKIRQRSNDKTSVFDIDMTPILQNVSLAITDLKNKLDLLKTFAGQKVTLDIHFGNPGFFVFSDNFSSLKFMSIALQYLDNKYIGEDELSKIFVIDEDLLILDYDLSGTITERIRSITGSFHCKVLQILLDGEVASIRAATEARDQFAEFVSGAPTNMILEKCSAMVTTVPFGIDHDTDVSFKMYKDPEQDISINKFMTTLGDLDIKILTRSAIVKEDE